jgi:hypothetical protein
MWSGRPRPLPLTLPSLGANSLAFFVRTPALSQIEGIALALCPPTHVHFKTLATPAAPRESHTGQPRGAKRRGLGDPHHCLCLRRHQKATTANWERVTAKV